MRIIIFFILTMLSSHSFVLAASFFDEHDKVINYSAGWQKTKDYYDSIDYHFNKYGRQLESIEKECTKNGSSPLNPSLLGCLQAYEYRSVYLNSTGYGKLLDNNNTVNVSNWYVSSINNSGLGAKFDIRHKPYSSVYLIRITRDSDNTDFAYLELNKDILKSKLIDLRIPIKNAPMNSLANLADGYFKSVIETSGTSYGKFLTELLANADYRQEFEAWISSRPAKNVKKQ